MDSFRESHERFEVRGFAGSRLMQVHRSLHMWSALPGCNAHWQQSRCIAAQSDARNERALYWGCFVSYFGGCDVIGWAMGRGIFGREVGFE